LADERVTLVTRNAHDWTDRAPAIATAVQALPAANAVLDGEVVALNESGASDFQLLQNALRGGGQERIAYYVFDLLFLNGEDLRDLPLDQRKTRLKSLLGAETSQGLVRYSDHVSGSGKSFFRAAAEAGLEGMISKRRDAPYRVGRARDWLKIKCLSRQEFVIGGYTAPGGTREYLGALHVGVWQGDELRYSGKVGTGFSQVSLRELAKQLVPLKRATSPFDDAPRERDTQWVEPNLVAEIAFTEVTRGGRLRHPSFVGLRADKSAKDVVREEPAPTAAVVQAPSKLKLTHPDKLLFVEEGISKQGLALYYASVAELMLPHVIGRPLTLFRCPEGQRRQCFFQKHASKGRPEALRTIPIRESEGKADYLYLQDSDGLLALVQMGVLEVHTWGARIDNVEHPDLLVIDLDPAPDVSWSRVAAAAHEVRQVLEQLELESFVKTTGGKGLHVTVPLVPSLAFEEAKSFAQQLALALQAHDPEHYLATSSKAKRQGRIFVDYLRNARGATFIAPYSTRAKPGAPVAVPLRWEDVAVAEPDRFRVSNVVSWRDGAAKAWPSFGSVKQRLTTAQTRALATSVQTRLRRKNR
jgi:bifunctional non-homologous end joining protein LigD